MKFVTKNLLGIVFLVLPWSGVVHAEELVERLYAIEDVTQVNVRGKARVEIRQGREELVQIVAPESVIDSVVVNTQGHALHIGPKDMWPIKSSFPITYRLTLQQISDINVFGAITMASYGVIQSDRMNLRVSGSSSLTIDQLHLASDLAIYVDGASKIELSDVQARHAELHLGGAGEAEVRGEADTQRLYLSGAAKFFGQQLKVNKADVYLSSAANAEIWAESLLSVSASGASQLLYFGDPTFRPKTSGVSSLIHGGEGPG